MHNHILERQFNFTRNSQSRWSAKVMSWIILLLPLTSGTLEINCSKDIKIQEIIGPCTSLKKNGPAIASTTIGQGNTIAWKLCGLDKDTCLTVFFNVSSTDKDPSGNVNQQLYIQTLTSYQSADGKSKL